MIDEGVRKKFRRRRKKCLTERGKMGITQKRAEAQRLR